MRRWALPVLLVAALVGAGAIARGERYDIRTGEWTLDKAFSRAFKRNFAAAVRMRTGERDSGIVRHADTRCVPRGPQPGEDSEPWRWRCRVRWYVRDRPEAGLATYGLRVDDRGCFQALSGAFPDLIPERRLERYSPNPLVYIRSCP